MASLNDVIESRLDRTVGEVNELIRQVADLNRQISGAEVGGREAPDLRDQRDNVLDKLSELAAIKVSPRADGTLAVHLGTATLVDGAVSSPITLGADRVPRAGSLTLHEPGGLMGALVDLTQNELPQLRQQLDSFARRFIEEVNALHTAGTGGVHIFDPTRLAAGTIAVSSDIDDPSNIAAVAGAPGDNTVALQLAGLRDLRITFAGGGETTFGGRFNSIVTGIGLQTEAAARSESVYRTLASSAEIRRSSVTGVSTDEEMMNLMRHQQAYQAATRLVQTADEMMQTILNMV
jgi:flagellar hook-associated protein 1